MNFYVSKVFCLESNKTKLVINTGKKNHGWVILKHPSSKIQYKQKHQAGFERDTEGNVRALYTRKEDWTLFSVPRGYKKMGH